MTALRRATSSDGSLYLIYWCQGCKGPHSIRVQGSPDIQRPCWIWDGNMEAPTFSPSVLVRRRGDRVCHTFVIGGMVQFLGDCTHEFAGQTLPLPPWPYADGEYGGVERL